MLIEEYQYFRDSPVLSSQKGKTIDFIFTCLKNTCNPFKKASSQPNLHKPLNENKLTQIFVEQIENFIKQHPNIGVKNQYSDTFHGTKGIPDFYFHKIEEGVHHQPIIVFEAKILSTRLGKKREQEYVIGSDRNGGIERFKSEMHGKGMKECGLLGFIKDKDNRYWNQNINLWINELANTKSEWGSDESLSEFESNIDYCMLKSIVHRKSDDLSLTHLWVMIK